MIDLHRIEALPTRMVLLVAALSLLLGACAGRSAEKDEATPSAAGRIATLPPRIVALPAPPDRRLPAVAGTFYPGSAAEIQKLGNMLLKGGAGPDISGKEEALRALIVPHAGWFYSGRTAAMAFARLRGRRFDRVIIVAPNHRDPGLQGVSCWYRGAYRTPLGDIPVDGAACRRLLASDELFTFRAEAHVQEHSLEVNLPFLQLVLGRFHLVPLIVGRQGDWNDIERLVRGLKPLLSDGTPTLLIASTDLSHFHTQARARELDGVIVKGLRDFAPRSIHDAVFRDRRAEACGCGPMVAVLETCRQRYPSARSQVLEYCSSARASGDANRVVGYVSALVFDGGKGRVMATAKPSKKIMDLSSEEKSFLLNVARKTIEARVQGKPTPIFEGASEKLQTLCGGFVTLSKGGELRGCIGYIQAVKPLVETVAEMAESAALKDPRFPPVTGKELPELSIEISVLSPFRKIDSVDEIEVGVHGLHLRRGWNSGLLLPQVATEYGWTRDEFLDHTCMKAGLPAGSWKDGDCEISIFSAEIFNEGEKH